MSGGRMKKAEARYSHFITLNESEEKELRSAQEADENGVELSIKEVLLFGARTRLKKAQLHV
jgi:hypothetical protein